MSKQVPIVPFLLNQRECSINYCTFLKEGYCNNRDIDMLESMFDDLGNRLKVDIGSHTITLDESKPFNCNYYQLNVKRCQVCKNELVYNSKEVNYVCYVCGHGMED